MVCRCSSPAQHAERAAAQARESARYNEDRLKQKLAEQFVRFGLDVYEAQVAHQHRDHEGKTTMPERADRAPVRVDVDELHTLRARIDKLLEGA